MHVERQPPGFFPQLLVVMGGRVLCSMPGAAERECAALASQPLLSALSFTCPCSCSCSQPRVPPQVPLHPPIPLQPGADVAASSPVSRIHDNRGDISARAQHHRQDPAQFRTESAFELQLKRKEKKLKNILKKRLDG